MPTGKTVKALITLIALTSANSAPSLSQQPPACLAAADSSQEHTQSKGIIVYRSSREEASQVAAVAQAPQAPPEIWTDQGTATDIPEEEWMLVP